MSDFQNWWDGYFHEINGQKETAQAAWQARGELDAVKIKELVDRLQEVATDWQVNQIKLAELTAKLDKARVALNSCLGGDDYYNRPIIEKALEELDK